jgi:hypothetical protein
MEELGPFGSISSHQANPLTIPRGCTEKTDNRQGSSSLLGKSKQNFNISCCGKARWLGKEACVSVMGPAAACVTVKVVMDFSLKPTRTTPLLLTKQSTFHSPSIFVYSILL